MDTLDDFLKQNFEAFQHPRFWFAKAHDLFKSAGMLASEERALVLRYETALIVASEKLDNSDVEHAEIECDEPNVFPIFLLYGYALENGLKAIIVDRDPSLIGREKIAAQVSQHDLVSLAELASLSTSDAEREFLRWLTQVVVWKGRYNAPRKPDALGTFWALDHLTGSTFDQCLEVIGGIFRRITAVLPRAITERRVGYGAVVRVSEE
ncbi:MULTISPECIES: hypothetical protein [unclassified Bradyrhizobium]|uniref:hypothetical protein n=1 Tax=unclassified Bradyrhizobium TaxID=2631580 RepID=UPI0027D5466E|nr:hypothetical protein TM233_65710 [Bradyrhizobium sp. TM233]GMP13043.1 hypothetical protein TM239_67870 [Bradyrhizobium sp. TM239]